MQERKIKLLKINLEADINNIAYLDYMQKAEVVRKEKEDPDIPEDENDNTGVSYTRTHAYMNVI